MPTSQLLQPDVFHFQQSVSQKGSPDSNPFQIPRRCLSAFPSSSRTLTLQLGSGPASCSLSYEMCSAFTIPFRKEVTRLYSSHCDSPGQSRFPPLQVLGPQTSYTPLTGVLIQAETSGLSPLSHNARWAVEKRLLATCRWRCCSRNGVDASTKQEIRWTLP